MLYRPSAAPPGARARFFSRLLPALVALSALSGGALCARAQTFEREVDVASAEVLLTVKNRTGRVTVNASEEQTKKVSIRARSPQDVPVTEKDVRVSSEGGRLEIRVEREATPPAPAPAAGQTAPRPASLGRARIDVVVVVPARSRVRVETEVGAVDVVGPVAEAEVKTDTGTIRADVPLEALRYNFRWTLSRPRLYSEVGLERVREKRGGTFEVAGRLGDEKAKREERIELRLETARGVILFGVSDEASVPADLRERELTEAARAIIRSGDQELTGAIRRIAPRLVGEYAKTLPPREQGPRLVAGGAPAEVRTRLGGTLVRLQATVTDRQGRALGGLTERDFTVVENNEPREVREVRAASAPFNLVLLLDVSGSVEERLDFIRKAALAFITTVGPQDRVAIVSFRDDVQLISDFTTDRALLAKRIKDIQAGGATALYDSIAYTLVNTLSPLRGERTAVVILSDGDDNRSFVPFTDLVEAVTETGALIYPLYVPSGLIPASGARAPAAATIDPTRSRFLTLTSRAESEGRRLAEISGGVYYHIKRLEQLQEAYDDVVVQLRTSYSITYESKMADRRDARVRVRVARDGASVRLSPTVELPPALARP
ncbi:MAG TPA: VWA domain-containing protein [Pyrinomonadaceae bacterium]|nr:VWA domain-containing protein [Pyrinomonadaceae bacterium]